MISLIPIAILMACLVASDVDLLKKMAILFFFTF